MTPYLHQTQNRLRVRSDFILRNPQQVAPQLAQLKGAAGVKEVIYRRYAGSVAVRFDESRGSGSALLAQVERSFTASGTLKCLMENKNALRFYQRHGWTIEAQGASPEGRYWLMRSPRPYTARKAISPGITSPCQYIWAATRPASWR